MKTLTNNTNQFLKSAATLALALCLTMGSAFAGANDSITVKKEVSAEEAAMIDDLLAEMEKAEDIENMFKTNTVTFEVYNNSDQLVFTGTQAQWDDKNNQDLISMKRKADFLMDIEGTNIYKIF